MANRPNRRRGRKRRYQKRKGCSPQKRGYTEPKRRKNSDSPASVIARLIAVLIRVALVIWAAIHADESTR